VDDKHENQKKEGGQEAMAIREEVDFSQLRIITLV